MSSEAYRLLWEIGANPGHRFSYDYYRKSKYHEEKLRELCDMGYLRTENIDGHMFYCLTEIGMASVEAHNREIRDAKLKVRADVKSTISLIISGLALIASVVSAVLMRLS